MTEEQKVSRITTVDGDVHDIIGDVDIVRYKVDKGLWLLTVDGWYVRGDKVVAVFERTDDCADLT